MTRYTLDPGFIKLRYDDPHRTHFQTLCVLPFGAVVVGTEPRFLLRDGSDVVMHTLTELYAAAMQPNLASTSTIVEATFWSKPTADADPIWIYTDALNLAGNGSGTETYTRQINRSFRTSNGHIMRNVIEACVSGLPNDTSTPLNPAESMSAFLLGANGFIVGRDNGYPAAALNYSTKTNDALRKLELGL